MTGVTLEEAAAAADRVRRLLDGCEGLHSVGIAREAGGYVVAVNVYSLGAWSFRLDAVHGVPVHFRERGPVVAREELE